MTKRDDPDDLALAGRDIHVAGIVQGVGFRPFVYGLALRHGLSGWVLNNSSGVDIRVYGCESALLAFVNDLSSEAPPLASIDRLDISTVSAQTWESDRDEGVVDEFRIRDSTDQPLAFVPISPDVATCPDCLVDLWNPHNRRFRYPFTNCTNCGPRFTIVRDIPYDRPYTTMAPFQMCPQCRSEYDDPGDRRFHAQPNACPDCGPSLSLIASPARKMDQAPAGSSAHGDDALIRARRLLDEGAIVAIKGLGGYHLACDAYDDQAIRTLRERKGRIDKPFAVMAPDLDAVRSFAVVSSVDAALLSTRQAPIVLLPKLEDCWLSQYVAPGNRMIGVMLPYTPMHHLLLARSSSESGARSRPPVFVMTSGNLSEEPIVKDNDEALTRLAEIADAFLQHDRDIFIHCDDSVIRSYRGRPMPIRRARGYAPAPIKLPGSLPPVLAVGGELKNTFCLTNGDYAFMSQHIGDMENLETVRAFERTVNHYTKIFRVQPKLVACDMHPRYLSTRWANQYATDRGLPLVEVQHHHAHIAAAMVEHGLEAGDLVIGVALDGTGYGPDGTIWGGEFLVAGYGSYLRAGSLRPAPLPGGDAAIRKPYRIALAYLLDAGVEWSDSLPPVRAATSEELRILRRQLETGLNTTATSSMGRLFDAIASLAGVRQAITYEAQAAMEFEALATEYDSQRLPYDAYQFAFIALDSDPLQDITRDPAQLASPAISRVSQFEIDSRHVIRQVAADVVDGVSPMMIASRFHASAACMIRDACLRLRDQSGIGQVALSGGVFQNLSLLEQVVSLLEDAGFAVLVHQIVPANDGGIALGQAMVAHHMTYERA